MVKKGEFHGVRAWEKCLIGQRKEKKKCEKNAMWESKENTQKSY